MIKTATPPVTQGSEPEQSDYPQTSKSATKQTAVSAENIKQQSVQASPDTQSDYDPIVQPPIYDDVVKELAEREKQYMQWQERLNELMKDPNNADRVVNFLTGLQFLKNKIAELKSQQNMMAVSSNGYTFQDNQTVLQTGSVRRKDKEALRIIQRDETNSNLK
jgi:hypothetical protein